MTRTGVAVHDDDAPPPEPERPLEPAELAAIQAAKAAKKARKAQRQAEKARLLAAEYARLTGLESPEASAASAEPSDEPPSSGSDERPTGRGLLVATSLVLAAALVFAVIALIVHLNAGDSSTGDAAAVRDDVLLAARQDIVVLNTLDYRSVDAGLKRWSDASTGALHASLARVSATEKKHITEARSVTTATVLDAAVVNLDVRAGSATVIASVELTVRPAGQQAVVKRERLSADLAKVGESWKVSSIGQVGVTLS